MQNVPSHFKKKNATRLVDVFELWLNTDHIESINDASYGIMVFKEIIEKERLKRLISKIEYILINYPPEYSIPDLAKSYISLMKNKPVKKKIVNRIKEISKSWPIIDLEIDKINIS